MAIHTQDARRQKFRVEVVEPHMDICPICRLVLVEKEAILAALAETRFPSKEVSNIWNLVLEDSALSAVQLAEREEFVRGVYYLADEAACSVDCTQLDKAFNDYFATL